MQSFWSRVQALSGRTLTTRSRSKEFDIVEVRSDRIIFVPRAGTGRERWISRKWLEHVDSLHLDESELLPVRLRQEFPDDQNLSYMAAIVHAARATGGCGEPCRTRHRFAGLEAPRARPPASARRRDGGVDPPGGRLATTRRRAQLRPRDRRRLPERPRRLPHQPRRRVRGAGPPELRALLRDLAGRYTRAAADPG